jgi:hypothetical protein
LTAMRDAVEGEHIARVVISPARSGAHRYQNPARVVLPARLACRAAWSEPGRGRSILRGAGGAGRKTDAAKRVGGARAKPQARLLPAYPKRAKPKGASSGRHTNSVPVARDSWKGQSPETAARWAGPSPRRRDYRRAKRYVGPSPRKRGGYLLGGESSEG